jgi:hypothetical protein
MDSYQISLIAIPPICAFIGFLGKYVVDKRTQYLQNINSKKLDIVESKLKKFYYPVHSNLLRENIIWNKVLNFYLSINDVDTEVEFIHKIFWELDKEMLEIHLDNQRLIQNNIIEMHLDETLTNSLMSYDEHVTIYNIIRKVEPDRPMDMDKVKWPAMFGSEYPREVLGLIDSQLKLLKKEQNDLIYSIV